MLVALQRPTPSSQVRHLRCPRLWRYEGDFRRADERAVADCKIISTPSRAWRHGQGGCQDRAGHETLRRCVACLWGLGGRGEMSLVAFKGLKSAD